MRMSMKDKIKNMMKGSSDKTDKGIDKAGDTVDKNTGGRHSDKVDRGQDTMRDRLGDDDRPADPPR
jgi:hypothetical protein